jgi:hypothetical protein
MAGKMFRISVCFSTLAGVTEGFEENILNMQPRLSLLGEVMH